MALSSLASPVAWALDPLALPGGAAVVSGTVQLQHTSPGALTIQQTGSRAMVDWQSFSIGRDALVTVNQESTQSLLVNRVTGATQSVLDGKLQSNGQVWLLNPNGVLMGQGGRIQTHGFLASTRSLGNADFSAGRFELSGQSVQPIVVQGEISSGVGGYAVLNASQLEQNGRVQAPQGSVVLATSHGLKLDLVGDRLLSFNVEDTPVATQLVHQGITVADGGLVALNAAAAREVVGSVVNVGGLVQANSVSTNNGVVVLGAGAGGQVQVSGTVLAQGQQVGQSGGMIRVQGRQITVGPTGVLSASGEGHGGQVLVGVGSNNTLAEQLTLKHGAKITAQSRSFGDGGFIETSATRVNIADGVNISTKAAQGKDGQWLIDPDDFTIAATGGNVTGAALSAALQNNHVTIQTLASSNTCSGVTCSAGASAGNGDIVVNDTISATGSGKTLTLQAVRDVNLNSAVSVDGLELTAVRDVNVGAVVSVGNQLSVNFSANPDFTPNSAAIPGSAGALNMTMNGSGFVGRIDLGASATVTINGVAHTVLRSAAEVGSARDAINANMGITNSYVLGNDIDLGNVSWVGIGNERLQGYQGAFDGLGHQVTGLNANSQYPGFFSVTVGARVSNLGVAGMSTVNATPVGFGGGLVGAAVNSTLRNVYAKVDVSNPASDRARVGGLVGYLWTSPSFAALPNSSITNAFSTGTVSTSQNATVGGLIGFVDGSMQVTNAFATGDVMTLGGSSNAGGLVGIADGATFNRVFATGRVGSLANAAAAGGLTGGGTGHQFSDAYATGAVEGAYAGGLAGVTFSSSFSRAYATGAVTGPAGQAGGIAGFANSVGTHLYWDDTSTGQATAVGGGGIDAQAIRVGQLTALPTGFTADVWRLSGGVPLLNSVLLAPPVNTTPVFVRLNCDPCSSTYGDLPVFSFALYDAATGGQLVTDAQLAGTALYSLTRNGQLSGTELGRLTDAGTYSVSYTGGLVAGNSSYQLAAGSGITFTVQPRALTVALAGTVANPLSKAYDASRLFTLVASNFTLGNFVDQQGAGASVNQTQGMFNSKDVAQANQLTVELNASNLVVGPGVNPDNYVLPSSVTAAANITPRALMISASSVAARQYDGTRVAAVTAGNLSGTVSGETLGLVTSALFDTADAGDAKAVTAAHVLQSTGTGLASNYTLGQLANESLTGRIDRRDLSAQATVADKVFDGGTATAVSVDLVTGYVGFETLAVSAVANFDTPAVGQRKSGVTQFTLNDGRNGGKASNYRLNDQVFEASITPAQPAVPAQPTLPVGGAPSLSQITQLLIPSVTPTLAPAPAAASNSGSGPSATGNTQPSSSRSEKASPSKTSDSGPAATSASVSSAPVSGTQGAGALPTAGAAPVASPSAAPAQNVAPANGLVVAFVPDVGGAAVTPTPPSPVGDTKPETKADEADAADPTLQSVGEGSTAGLSGSGPVSTPLVPGLLSQVTQPPRRAARSAAAARVSNLGDEGRW